MKDATPDKKISPLKIVLWSIFGVLLLLIFIVLGALLVEKYIKKAPVPMFAGYASLVVTTGSMNGTINEGDLVIIKKTDDYQLTDIVTYVNAAKEVVTHRLVNYGPEEGTFIAKGDANNTLDLYPVSIDQIAGEVVLTIPKLGLVVQWFTNEGGVIYVVAMIAIAIAGVYLWNAMKPEPETETEEAEGGEKSQEESPEGGEKPQEQSQNDNEQ